MDSRLIEDIWPVHILTNVWIVCGSRDYLGGVARERVCLELDRLCGIRRPQAIYQGGCRGPDRMAATWAGEHKILVVSILADWAKRGKAAGPYRNEEMATRCGGGGCIAFWDGKSRGTADMIRRAEAHGMYCHWVQI